MSSLASINIRFAVDLREFSSEMQNSLRTIDKVGQKFQQVGRSMSAYVTLPILAAGAAAVKFASDYNESLNKVDVSFKASAAEVKEFSKTALTTAGISEGTALDMAAAYGDMGTSMGLTTGQAAKMSTSLVGLAGDLASFKNISIDIANTAISAIFSGETESLKKLGIVLTEVNLKQFALNSGIKKSYETMTQAEKVQLRYNYILSVTKNAQGDFERTQGGAANQTRIFTESLKQVGQQLGAVILPLFTKVITVINEKVKAFSSLSEGTKTTIVVIAGLVAVIGPLLLGIGAVAAIIPTVVAGFAILSGAIVPLLAGITLLMGVFLIFKDNAKQASNAQNDLNKAIESGNKNAVNEVSSLDKLYASATNIKLATDKRKEAVEQLQALYPAYFRNIDAETIKNGKAETSYNQLRNAIFNKSRAAAIENQLQANANQRISKELEIQNKVNDARKRYLDLIKNGKDTTSNVSVGSTGGANQSFVSNAQKIKEAAIILGAYKSDLDKFYSDSKKQDEILLNAKQIYDKSSAKLSENELERIKAEESAVAASVKGKEELFKKGSIAFYEKEIEGLKKLQDEIPVTNAAWKTYGAQIDAVQKKIDAIKSPTVKLPRPELPTEVDFQAPVLNIPYYEEQIARYQKLQSEFSTNNEEGRAKYKIYADAISNTEIIIQDIKGVDNLISSTEVVKSTLLDLTNIVNQAIESLAESAAVGFGEMIGGIVLGTSSVGDAMKGMMMMIGGFMKDLGKSLIAAAIAAEAFKKLLAQPLLAVAAGIALVALGTIVQAKFSAGPKTQAFANGGIVGGASFYGDKILARVNSGELVLNNKQQKAVFGAMSSANSGSGDVTVIPSIKLVGSDFLIMFERAQNRKTRIG